MTIEKFKEAKNIIDQIAKIEREIAVSYSINTDSGGLLWHFNPKFIPSDALGLAVDKYKEDLHRELDKLKHELNKL